MGWGVKKGAAAPQPDVKTPANYFAAGALSQERPATFADDEPIEPHEKPTEAGKAKLEWLELKSRKGWTEQTVIMKFYDFIDSRELFADLVKFTRGRR